MFQKLCVFFPLLLFTASAALPAQVASRTVGVTVFYYDSLQEAVAAVGTADATADNAATTGTSIEQPDEITLLVDIVLDAPLTIKDGQHIRLVPGGSDRTIHRSPNLIEYPLIWLRGDFASISLGKPGMGHELVLDGGYLNSPPINAHAPLASIHGLGSKLIMYDKVTLQNNINNADAASIGSTSGGTSDVDSGIYFGGSGVFISTRGEIQEPKVEFIMKGGTIRGNINDVHSSFARGGAVYLSFYGIFTMEGGVIMNNTSRLAGGGVFAGSRASFYKRGGIIYGKNAPAGYRNTSLKGEGSPPFYGHAVWVAIFKPIGQFRDDTVGENDNLSYTSFPGMPKTLKEHDFGKGEKWDNPYKVLRRRVIAVILPIIALTVFVTLFLRKRAYKKMMKIALEAKKKKPETVFENMQLTVREKEVGILLLSELPMKQIADVMDLTYATADYHARKLYRKMGVQGRTELLLMKSEKGKGENEQGTVKNDGGGGGYA